MVAHSLKVTLACAAVSAAAGVHAAGGPSPGLGRELTPQELAGWNITVFADGTGFPAGGGTVSRGKEVYDATCAACHGAKLEGGLGPALAGGKGSLASEKPVRTVGSYWPYASTLFDYVRRAMPMQAPQSLSNDDVYSVAGYILNVNGLLPANAAVNGSVLAKVQMPNRDGFYVDDRPDARDTRCMKDCPPVQPVR